MSARSAAVEIACAMAKPRTGLWHGAIARDGETESIYCARCPRWLEVWAAPELALAVHEVIDHN
jgi:hypothetical protein